MEWENGQLSEAVTHEKGALLFKKNKCMVSDILTKFADNKIKTP